MKKYLVFLMAILAITIASCGQISNQDQQPTSSSGAQKKTIEIQTDADGFTVEQKQIQARYDNDNKPGSIKHLYIISAYSGQTIIYSTVKGKVTSSGKRLTPTSVLAADPYQASRWGIPIKIGNEKQLTSEVLQDDGTYGQSDPYIYWFDVKGIYHQHYITGGQIVHISDQPLNVKGVIINMELTNSVTNEK